VSKLASAGTPRPEKGSRKLSASPTTLRPALDLHHSSPPAGPESCSSRPNTALAANLPFHAIGRWFGPVAFDRFDVDYVGIHLDLPRGRHGGAIGGITYFEAETGTAEFIRASKLVPSGAAGGGSAVAAAASPAAAP
jgi:hypothetical protein